jgi:hypothetical protein
MISSDDRVLWLRGFSRTRMSPEFCAVANSPSSEPVRREYDATSGVSATTFSMIRTWRSVSLSALPAGVR